MNESRAIYLDEFLNFLTTSAGKATVPRSNKIHQKETIHFFFILYASFHSSSGAFIPYGR